MNKYFQAAQSIKDEIIGFRRELHQIPGLGFDIEDTAKYVENYLDFLGIKSRRCAKTGVVAVIEGKNSDGPVIGLRADMDGMPVKQEEPALFCI